MYTFYNGELPNHSDNYLLRLHQPTNIKQDLLLCKNTIYPE